MNRRSYCSRKPPRHELSPIVKLSDYQVQLIDKVEAIKIGGLATGIVGIVIARETIDEITLEGIGFPGGPVPLDEDEAQVIMYTGSACITRIFPEQENLTHINWKINPGGLTLPENFGASVSPDTSVISFYSPNLPLNMSCLFTPYPLKK